MFDNYFYQIIICLVTLLLVFVVLAFNKKKRNASANNTISYPNDIEILGAAAQKGLTKVENSPYYTSRDFYNMKSTDSLTILSNFKTYQQTQEYTCGPACIVMVMNYYGYNAHEMEIAKSCGTQPLIGTNTEQLVNYFKSIGWNVSSSLDLGEGSLELLRENLKKGLPTLIEWVDWGGHWQVVIGYDTMGTDTTADDVIVFADPYDTSDHNQDGYYTFPAERFLSMWFDHHCLPEGMRVKQWICATPPEKQ